MSHPLISVVTGVYNGERYLRESLESVLSQKGVEMELIVVDDGSTDSTPEILNSYAARDSRIRVIAQGNEGLTQALIRGCAEARGELIARHDADDLSLRNRLQAQAKSLLENSGLSMVSCWSYAIGPEGEDLWENKRSGDSTAATRDLLERLIGPPGHGSVMFRRADYREVGGYRSQFLLAQDIDLWLRLAEVGDLGYVPEFLYAFRVSEGGASSDHRTRQHQLGALALSCHAARIAGESELPILERVQGLSREARHSKRSASTWKGSYFIASCLLRRKDPRAAGYFRSALRRRPISPRAWFGLIRSRLGSWHRKVAA